MSKKKSTIWGIFNFKCPRCREGDLFETSTWSFSKPFDMPSRCPQCDLNYMPEPGFYWGAMYVGYMLTGGLFLGIALVTMFAFGWTPWAAIGLVLGISAVFFIYFFRLARSVWIHLMIGYDPEAAKSNSKTVNN